jgi:hypothetical protein
MEKRMIKMTNTGLKRYDGLGLIRNIEEMQVNTAYTVVIDSIEKLKSGSTVDFTQCLPRHKQIPTHTQLNSQDLILLRTIFDRLQKAVSIN